MLLFHNEFGTQNEISKYKKAQANWEPRRQQKGRSRSIVPCFLESPLQVKICLYNCQFCNQCCVAWIRRFMNHLRSNVFLSKQQTERVLILSFIWFALWNDMTWVNNVFSPMMLPSIVKLWSYAIKRLPCSRQLVYSPNNSNVLTGYFRSEIIIILSLQYKQCPLLWRIISSIGVGSPLSDQNYCSPCLFIYA